MGVCGGDSQAGNQVGESFWRMLLAEHGLDEDGVRLVVCVHLPPSRVHIMVWSVCSTTKAMTLNNWQGYVPSARNLSLSV